MKLEVGQEYKINHARKGQFFGKILSDDGMWVNIEITRGGVEGMTEDWRPGEQMDVRKSLCSFELSKG